MEPRCCSKEEWGCQEPLTKVLEKLKSQTQGHEHNTKMSICRISSLPSSTPRLEGLGWRGCAPFWKKPSGNFPGDWDPQRSLLYCLRCLLRGEALLRASSSPSPLQASYWPHEEGSQWAGQPGKCGLRGKARVDVAAVTDALGQGLKGAPPNPSIEALTPM